MKTIAIPLALVCLLLAQNRIQAQGTAFTYQGRLNVGAGPANGVYDLRFRVASDPLGNNYVGASVLTSGVPVSNGLFTVAIDFGAGLFTGSNYWLEVDVRTNGTGGYTTLNPLQPLTPAPYAIMANTASNLLGTVSSGQLSGAYSGALTFSNPADSFSGTFAGNGAGVTNVNATTLSGLSASSFWNLTGNSGTTPGANYIGTPDNQPLILKVNGKEAERFEPTTDTPNVVGGYSGNLVQPGLVGVTIGGGGTVAGSQPNSITNNGNYGTIAGGYHNTVTNYGGAVLAGSVNFNGGSFGTIGAGQFNTVLSDFSTIAGGYQNTIQTSAYDSSIGGGIGNGIQSNAFRSTISGGYNNSIQTNSYYSVVGGGSVNSIQTGSPYSTLSGGVNNTIQTNAQASTIAGGDDNTIQTNSGYSTIGGGYINTIQTGSPYSTIPGGVGNTIQSTNQGSTIGGGDNNSIQTNSSYSTVGGGFLNVIQTNSSGSTISGGANNLIQGDSPYSTVSGGTVNTIQGNSWYSTIAGGYGNTNQSGDWYCFIGNGYENVIQTNVSSSVIAGGSQNVIQTNATACVIGGGVSNTIRSYTGEATIPGGFNNTAAGPYSYAAGQSAQALHPGAFVWSDDSSANYFASTGANQFLIRAAGGVGIGVNNPGVAMNNAGMLLDVGGRTRLRDGGGGTAGLWFNTFFSPFNANEDIGFLGVLDGTRIGFYGSDPRGTPFWGLTFDTATGNVGIGTGTAYPTAKLQVINATCDGNNWNNSSDRNLKENFEPVDSREILAQVADLPISRWNYKADPETIHLGPVAQDFYAAFAVGPDDKHIATVDEGGVALAAIQGLNRKVEADRKQLQDELKAKDAEIQDLKRSVAELKELVSQLAQTRAK